MLWPFFTKKVIFKRGFQGFPQGYEERWRLQVPLLSFDPAPCLSIRLHIHKTTLHFFGLFVNMRKRIMWLLPGNQ